MQKVIITGANGFLGSALAVKLAEQGVEIYAVVREQAQRTGKLMQYSNIHIVFCDLEKITQLPLKLSQTGFDAFYHFAWAGTSGITRTDYTLQLNNVRFCCDAVKVASILRCKKFIFAGSIMEYESANYIAKDGCIPSLSYIYSTAKLAAHFMAKTVAVNLKIEFIEAIISNIYGVGEHSQRFVNTTLRKFLNQEKVKFTAGEQLYDFIYISDAVEAFQIIGENGQAQENYYIGNPHPKPLKDFIVEMYDFLQPSYPLLMGEIPFNGVSLTYKEFDTTKLQKDFDFIPKVSFYEGITMLVEWIKTEGWK